MTPPFIPPTMQAWTFTARGPPSQTLNLTYLPTPSHTALTPTQILLRISHAALFQGFPTMMTLLPHLTSTPWIPPTDFSALVIGIGSSVHSVAVGEWVVGAVDPKRWAVGAGEGSLAEYVIVTEGSVVRIEGMENERRREELSGIVGNGCTAVQFVQRAGVERGMSVLVTGASGGLGTLVTQVVRERVGGEGWIVGTCSSVNEELVRGLGCDEVIDYRTTPILHVHLAEHYASRPFDVIIDIAGSDDLLYRNSPNYLKPTGVFLNGGNIRAIHGGFASMISFLVKFQLEMVWPRVLGGTPRKVMLHSASIDGESLKEVARLVEEGHLRGVVDSVYEMEDGLKAFEKLATGRARGKVVVHVQDF